MTPTIHELIGDNPALVPALRAHLQQHEEDARREQSAGGPSFRAEAGEAAAEPVESDGAGESGCAHGVLTIHDDPALTCSNASAPVSQSESVEEHDAQRTPGAPPYRTDPDQPRSDLMKRTRRSLVSEVRSLRHRCAKVRRRLKAAEQRITELEEGTRG